MSARRRAPVEQDEDAHWRGKPIACAWFLGLVVLLLLFSPERGISTAEAQALACPSEMVRVGGACIDRWEASLVDKLSGVPLSPFYPPDPRLLGVAYDYWSAHANRIGPARVREVPLPPLPEVMKGEFTPMAVSRPGVLPQGYLSRFTAERACQAAGKRLCTESEWVRACRSGRSTKHPYGDEFVPGRCNVFRNIHPAYELHGNSSVGHLDPRLHLVLEEGELPVLLKTGAKPACVSMHAEDRIYDMVGNLDEWIADEKGVFVGGFYSRGTREGCGAKIENHGPTYADYSLGVRCCKD